MTAIEPKLTEKFHQDFLNNNKQNALQRSVVKMVSALQVNLYKEP